METKEYSIYNKTRESAVCSGIAAINSTREPLTALRVMVEGLGSGNETGLWLTHVTSFPMVPRLSPFDLVYLDKNHCVVDRYELLPAAEMPRFRRPADSALILPFQTISSARIDAGDELFMDEVRAAEANAQAAAPEAAAGMSADLASEPSAMQRAEVLHDESRRGEVQVAEPLVLGPIASLPAEETAALPAQVLLTITEAPVTGAAVEDVPPATAIPAKPAKSAEAKKAQEKPAFKRRGKRKKNGKRQAFEPVTQAAMHQLTVTNLAAQSNVADAPAASVGTATFDSPFLSSAQATSPVESTSATLQTLEIPASLEQVQSPDAIPVVAQLAELPSESDSLATVEIPAAPDADTPDDTIAGTPASSYALILAAQTEVPSIPLESLPAIYAAAPEPLAPDEILQATPSQALIVPFAIRKPAPAPHRASALPPVPQPAAAAEQTDADSTEKKPFAHRILRWLYPSMYKQDRRHSTRRPLPGLVAYDWSANGPERLEIGNISSTGIYLLTEKRWQPGEMLSLTLQQSGPLEESAEQRIDLEAGAVRWGNDGVGLTFAWPEGMDLRLWETPVRVGMQEGEPEYVVREMRLARALGFLRRICPAVVDRAWDLFYAELSNVRAGNAVEIALKAEKLLAHDPSADKMLAHPDVILRILEDGSWVDVEGIQQLWAGLLATSCTTEGQDDSNLVYVHLLSLLAPIHAKILSAACAKAMSVMATREAPSPHLIASSPEEMARLTGSTNLMKVHRSIAELSDLGLLEKSSRVSPHAVSMITRTRPTHLGLEMYARCSGERGAA